MAGVSDILSQGGIALSSADPQPPAKITKVSVGETRPLGSYRSLRLGAEAEIVGLESPEEVMRGLKAWVDRRFAEMIKE